MAGIKQIGRKLSELNTRRVALGPKAADPFYQSREWQTFIASVIKRRGRVCEDIDHDPSRLRSGVRIFGDHIIERRDGGADLDERNILLRCGSCHTRKTAETRKARRDG